MFYKTILLVLMLMTFGASIKPHQPYGDDPCTECEQVVGTIHMLLANNETETSVLAAMQQVCGMLPSVYQQLVSLDYLEPFMEYCVCTSYQGCLSFKQLAFFILLSAMGGIFFLLCEECSYSQETTQVF